MSRGHEVPYRLKFRDSLRAELWRRFGQFNAAPRRVTDRVVRVRVREEKRRDTHSMNKTLTKF